MADLKSIMSTAWKIKRERDLYCTFAEALSMSWAISKGFTECFQVSYVDADYRVSKTIGFARSDEECTASRIAQARAFIAKGLRPMASNSFNLKIYAPVEVAVAAPVLARAA